MVVTIKIGENVRERNSPGLVQWLNQQITDRRNNGDPLCVIVSIRDSEVDLHLSVGQCGGGGGGGRPFTHRENQIIELWRNRVTDKPHFTGGNINAFLQSL